MWPIKAEEEHILRVILVCDTFSELYYHVRCLLRRAPHYATQGMHRPLYPAQGLYYTITLILYLIIIAWLNTVLGHT